MGTDIIAKEDWGLLLGERQGKCVSLFMPTHRYGAEIQQDPVRLKNLLREAEGQLEAAGLTPEEARELLSPMESLRDDPEFWKFQSDGLALFSSPGLFRSFRVPLDLEEEVRVGDRFQVRPLLPLLAGDGPFYILALSLHQVRLLEATRDDVRPIELPGVPGSFDEALGYDQYDKSVQSHTSSSTGLGRRSAIFHGHGDGDEERQKRDIQSFFRLVSEGLERFLKHREAPMVLATVEPHVPLYRAVNRHPVLLEEAIPGNPEAVADKDLHARAWPLVAPFFLKERDEALRRFTELQGSPRAASGLKEILPAAHQGRVEVLFLDRGKEGWGFFDPVTGKARIHSQRQNDDEDLLEMAAVHTLTQGGTVYALGEDQPLGAEAAAVLRY